MKTFHRYGFLAAGSLILAACGPSPSFFMSPASSIARDEAGLFRFILWLAVIVFVIVEGGLIWILIRDHRRRGDDQLPRQIHGNTNLETIWTVIPVILVVILFAMTVQTMHSVAAPAPSGGDVNVQVIGHRWWWEFYYPDLGIRTANEMHIPVGTTVQITLDSVDVIHSFWVPQLSGKTDAIPGQTNHMWLTADRTGVFIGQCAEFCGTEHAMMRIELVVDSPEDFTAWASNQQLAAALPSTEDEQAGYKQLTTACATCHSLDPADPRNLVGPNLAHLLSRSTFAGAVYDLNEENLRSWLHDTQAMKPDNDMNLKLTPTELEQIMAYLKLLK